MSIQCPGLESVPGSGSRVDRHMCQHCGTDCHDQVLQGDRLLGSVHLLPCRALINRHHYGRQDPHPGATQCQGSVGGTAGAQWPEWRRHPYLITASTTSTTGGAKQQACARPCLGDIKTKTQASAYDSKAKEEENEHRWCSATSCTNDTLHQRQISRYASLNL